MGNKHPVTPEPADVVLAARDFLSPDAVAHETAARKVGDLLRLLPTSELMRLGEMLNGFYWGGSERWSRIKLNEAEGYLATASDTAVGNLLSLHRDGYVREAAVRFLVNAESGDALRFLLIRQNDWVDSISELAQAGIRQRLESGGLDDFVCHTRLLLRLLNLKRRDLTPVVALYIDRLLAPESELHLHEALASCDELECRKLTALLLCREGEHLAYVVRAGVNSDDGVVRALCIQRAIDSLPKEECSRIATGLLSDKFMPARMAAYELAAVSRPSDSDQIWRQGLFDTSRTIRDSAIFYLRKSGCDAAAVYREHLSVDPQSLPALSGLVACGDVTDVGLFTMQLNSPYASRRAEAVRGVSQVGGESDVLGLQRSLCDVSARVVRVAHRELAATGVALDAENLFKLISQCEHLAGKQAVLQLLYAMGRWPAVSFLIQAAVGQDKTVANYSCALVRSAFASPRDFVPPTAEQSRQIQKAIDTSRELLRESVVIELRFYLSSFGFSV